ncbi:MAG: hypothetical protein AAF733_09595 [Verrucomicrobiota bacterium]
MDSTVDSRLKDLRDTLSQGELQCLAMQLLQETRGDAGECPVGSDPNPTDDDSLGEPIVEFFLEHKYRSLIELAPPAPAAKFYPKWLRSLKSHYHRETEFQTYPPELKTRQNATIKACPAVNDYLRTGFVLPLWCDFAITFHKDGGFSWQTPNNEFEITTHPREQYDTMPNRGFPTELKFISPWYCRTPPGYSFRALPCYYHFDHLWSALPGVVHADQNHTTHINALFHIEEGQIVLPRGTPMMHIIPFRREKYELDVHVATEDDTDEIDHYRALGFRFLSSGSEYESPRNFS